MEQQRYEETTGWAYDRNPAGTDTRQFDEITAGLRAFTRTEEPEPEESPVSYWASVALIGLLALAAVAAYGALHA